MEYRQINLASDIGGTTNNTNPYIVNPWGLVVNNDGNFWSTLNGNNLLGFFNAKGILLNSYVTPDGPSGLSKLPFLGPGGPTLVFVTESGNIGVYQPGLPNPIIVKYTDVNSVYKGVAVLDGFIYVANFTNFRVDVFDVRTFILQPSKSIIDSDLTNANYGPFNVYAYKNQLFISYALVNGHDDQSGPGNGYINYWNRGQLKRIANRDPLNSPWGMIRVDDELLVGNFGDGFINVFKLTDRDCSLNAEFCSPLKNRCDTPIRIDGLWGIALRSEESQENNCDCSKCVRKFRKEPNCDKQNRSSIWFAAGSQSEAHGLIGVLKQIN
jgi:hypothetical protein